MFQSTFPRGKRRSGPVSRPDAASSCFNPRSREGNDLDDYRFDESLPVSIHVPARETTVYWHHSSMFIAVSIHVPARETTVDKAMYAHFYNVSIHVPARETTMRTFSFIC